MLTPRRRGLASVNAEVRDGIVPAASAITPAYDQGPTASGPGYRLVALIIACALFMEQMDATVLATALPTMARDFGVRAPSHELALTSYLLALAIFIPASGQLADRFGSHTIFRPAILIFMAGSLALRPLALAPDRRRALPAGHRRRDDDPGRPAGAAAQRRQAGHGVGHVVADHARR